MHALLIKDCSSYLGDRHGLLSGGKQKYKSYRAVIQHAYINANCKAPAWRLRNLINKHHHLCMLLRSSWLAKGNNLARVSKLYGHQSRKQSGLSFVGALDLIRRVLPVSLIGSQRSKLQARTSGILMSCFQAAACQCQPMGQEPVGQTGDRCSLHIFCRVVSLTFQ